MRPKYRHPKALLAAALISSTPFAAFATEDDADEVVVIGNRIPTPVSETGTSVTLLTAEDILESQEVSVLELLRSTPGVTISRSGSIGTVASLRIRGAEPGQTLVFIDGIKINDLSLPTGSFNFCAFTTGNIERIEILRGPPSTLYGSDAIGGVINIITKKAETPFSASGSLEGGSFGTFRGSANLGVRSGIFSANLSASGVRTNGFSAADEDDGNTESDPFHTTVFTGNFGLEPTGNLSFNGLIRRASSRVEYDAFDFSTGGFVDGDGVNETEDIQGSIGAVWSALGGKIENSARISWSNIDRVDFEFGAMSFISASRNRTIDLLSTIKPHEKITVLVGGQFQSGNINTELLGPFASSLAAGANINSGFAEIMATPAENLTVTFGVRHDDHETFGGHTTFRITANFRIPGTGTIVRANWGEGFKAPSLFQLFSAFGDPALLPESSKGWEIGVEQQVIKDNTSFSATWFKRTTKNQIDFSLATFTYGNIGASETKGVEISFHTRPLKEVSFEANYTYIDATNLVSASPLLRRPRHVFNAAVSANPTSRLSVTIGLNYTGQQLDTGVTLPAFTVVDVRATYDLYDSLTLFARLENALDETYQEVSGFGTADISAYAGVRGSF
ncbi:MAG: TonB-dependent receptor [Sphingomonadales bacterium]